MPRRNGPPRGYTLIELLSVVTLIGILAGLAAPVLSGALHMHRARYTLERLAGDIHFARMQAIRLRGPVEIRFSWDRARRCVSAYGVHDLREDAVLRTVEIASSLPGGCVSMTNARQALRFNSRGLPHGVMARTFVATSRAAADTLVVSQLGRILREY